MGSQTVSVGSARPAEGIVRLEVFHDAGDGPSSGSDGHDKAAGAEPLQEHPPPAPPRQPALRDVHLHGEVDGERPEPERADESDDGAEEGQQHGHGRGDAHVRRAPREPDGADGERRHGCPDPDLPVADQRAARPGCGGAALDVGEDGLRHDLVGAHQVHHHEGVGHVQQPEGLVEAEPRQQVVRGRPAERRVPDAAAQQVDHRRHRHAHRRRLLHHSGLRRRRRPDRVLDLQQDQGETVRERDVPEGLQAPPHLLHHRHAGAGADDAGEAPPWSSVCCNHKEVSS